MYIAGNVATKMCMFIGVAMCDGSEIIGYL